MTSTPQSEVPWLPVTRTCATDRVHERLLREVPGYAERRARCENEAWQAQRGGGTVQRTGCTTIPVVVHVVHHSDPEDISEEQIVSQIETLNADFRNLNADGATVPEPFAGLRADARVTFELAGTDPVGAPTSGITRTRTSVDGFGADDAVKSSATGGADPWPSDQFLNLWVCRLAGGLLGYAQFPGGPAETDGVVITHTACGSTGTASAPFNLGRTLTHEVGHWLNLRHIWGDDGTGCHGSDFVDDTPNQGGPNAGKPTFPTLSCDNAPDGDLFMNYLDYVDDDTMTMFTHGQVTRMQTALAGVRSSIGSTGPCGSDEPVVSDQPGAPDAAPDPAR